MDIGLRRDQAARFILVSIAVLSVLLTSAVALNFMLHVYETYSESDRLFELWLNGLGIIINGLFSIGILVLYSRIGSAQEEQRDLMEEQRNIDENQRTIMREQANISENQHRLEQLRQQFNVDLEGRKPINDDEILICISNHGEGVAMSPQLITSVSYFGGENYEVTYGVNSCPLRKVCEEEYRDRGRIIGARETDVELISEASFRNNTEQGTQDDTFSEMATKLSLFERTPDN